MIRFRFQEDERRFILLHSEMFEKLARAGLSEVVGSNTLRNVGKIEQMAYMEGIRQGLAMSTIASAMIQEETAMAHEPPPFQPIAQKAFQLHALIYGSKDTPLRDVEKEWLGKLNLNEDHLAQSWLDDKPMRFAPATLRELEGSKPPVAPMMSVQSAHKPMPVKSFDPAASPGMTDLMVTPESVRVAGADAVLPFDPTSRLGCPTCGAEPGQPCVFQGPGQGIMSGVHRDRYPPPEAMHGAEVTVPEPWHKGEYEPDDPEPDVDPLDLVEAEVATEEAEERANQPESPEFLDTVRDAIQTMKRGGWDPKIWQDLILGLHRHMSVDAGFLDIQLTTHVGRTVLDQCGLVGMAPPEMVSFDFLPGGNGKTLVGRTADGKVVDTAPTDADDGTMGFGKAHGWEDP